MKTEQFLSGILSTVHDFLETSTVRCYACDEIPPLSSFSVSGHQIIAPGFDMDGWVITRQVTKNGTSPERELRFCPTCSEHKGIVRLPLQKATPGGSASER